MLSYNEVAKVAKKYSVLYVEDDKDVASQMQQILSGIFKTMYYAKDGIDGYASFLKHKPDIIITDVQMPNLNGIQMSAKIRGGGRRAYGTNYYSKCSRRIFIFA
jgi:CheY-like chemotaxis protein